MLLGLDEDGIGAICAWTEVDGPEAVLLQAVAVRHCDQQKGHGRKALETGLSDMVARARQIGAKSLVVQARIAIAMGPSKKMCTSVGLEYEEMLDDKLEAWSCLRDL